MAATNTAHHEMETLQSEDVSEDSDSDMDEGGAVKVITKRDTCRQSRIVCLVFTALMAVIFIGTALALVGLSHRTSAPNDDADSIDNYVLPNTSLSVSINTDTMIKGSFVVTEEEQRIAYDFVSIVNSSMEYIEFQTTDIFFEKWRGFSICHLVEDDISLKLIHANSEVSLIRVGRVHNISSAETQVLQSFLGSFISEHFVELSIKLGAMGFVGDINRAIQDLHRFSLWMWNVVNFDDNINISQWVDLDEELEKANAVNRASRARAAGVETIQTWNAGKKLLQFGRCGAPRNNPQCENACFGMCGNGCNCWESVCGTCDCWQGCLDHDQKCCDNGYFSYCCLNVFWVECNGSGSCE